MGIPGKLERFQITTGTFSLHFSDKKISLFAFLIGGFFLLGWIYNIPVFKSIAFGIPTLIGCMLVGAFLGLCYAVRLAINGNSAGSVMARKLLPVALFLPILIKSICALSYHDSGYAAEFKFMIESVLDIIAFLGFICWNAHYLDNIEKYHSQAEQALQRLNTELKQRLEECSIQLKVCQEQFYHAILTERTSADEVLKQAYAELEMRVKERTAQLHRANIKLRHLASVDYLTQVANRRQFDRYLNQQWQQLEQEQKPLSLIMCDIDYFKLYNDCYGHQAGDGCLTQVAHVISEVVKGYTRLVARYGGEEFAVILPNTNSSEAVHIAKQIQVKIARAKIAHMASPISRYLTLSIGVATTIPNSESFSKSLIETADEALYSAKEQGRNRYCVLSA
ncbi:hypothetical protein NUACC21_71950 [Scytonema sp. NUACC21]